MTDARAAKRRPGRPRSAAAEQAILRAALALAAETGLTRMTMEGVAARAGVGKATIYRRWASKEELFADALRSVASDMDLPPDRGSFRADWLDVMGPEFERLAASGAARILPRLMSEAADDPQLYDLLVDRMVRPRRRIAAELLRRGMARGELRGDLDSELVIDLLIGPMIYRALISATDADALRDMPQQILDLALPALAPDGP